MGRAMITEKEMIARVNVIIGALSDGEWHSTEKLEKETGLTAGQIKGAVKFERRYFLEKPEKCGRKYILSGKKGYKLTETDEEYIAMYKSMYSWGKSVLITISPIGTYLQGKGFDMRQIRIEAMNGTGDNDSFEVGGKDSWHEDE